MTATAYAIDGIAADGTFARKGTVAADPDVLPLGSLIRVEGAGLYSGVYKVIDTGPMIQGREIDIFMDTVPEAKKFGRRKVTVYILELGDNQPAARPSSR